jgi:cobalt/nickel transport protein
MIRRGLVPTLLVLAVVALFAVPLLIDGGTADYSGTDSRATALIQEQDPHYRPWFESVFSPSSGEVESGLFALQAALGGGALGYVLGRLRGRRALREAAPTPEDGGQ